MDGTQLIAFDLTSAVLQNILAFFAMLLPSALPSRSGISGGSWISALARSMTSLSACGELPVSSPGLVLRWSRNERVL